MVTPLFACLRHHRSLQKWHNKSSGEESEEICFCTKPNPDVNSSLAIRQCHESGESDNNSIDRYLFNMARKIAFYKKSKISASPCEETRKERQFYSAASRTSDKKMTSLPAIQRNGISLFFLHRFLLQPIF